MKCGKCHGRFLCVGAFLRERMDIIVFRIVRPFASTVLFPQFPLCRTLVVVSIVLRYTNKHHHPYIHSTTVLFDIYIDTYLYTHHSKMQQPLQLDIYIIYIYIYIYIYACMNITLHAIAIYIVCSNNVCSVCSR